MVEKRVFTQALAGADADCAFSSAFAGGSICSVAAQLWIVRPHSHTHIMKKHIALGLVASTLFIAGCCTSHHATTADAVPAGSFRLVVDDAVKDETFRIASLKVLSLQSGRFSVGVEGGGRAYGDFLVSATDRLREGRVLFIASRATDSRTTNAYILAGLQVMAKGGDGGMLSQSSCAGTYYPSKDTKLADFASMTAKDGIYPLDTPLEIGEIDGKPVTLTVGKQPL